MVKNKGEVIADIEEYMESCGGELDEWYVGIAAKPRKRLFDDHSVDEDNGNWIFVPATSSAVARRAEKYFLDRGAQGGPGGGDEDTRFVYAYRITMETVE